MLDEPMPDGLEPVTPDERLLPLGGVKGRNPPSLFAGGRVLPRGDDEFPGPIFRSAPPRFDGRLLLDGGVNGRYPPRFPF